MIAMENPATYAVILTEFGIQVQKCRQTKNQPPSHPIGNTDSTTLAITNKGPTLISPTKCIKLTATYTRMVFAASKEAHYQDGQEAMCKAETTGNDDCPVTIKLVTPPACVLDTWTLDKFYGQTRRMSLWMKVTTVVFSDTLAVSLLLAVILQRSPLFSSVPSTAGLSETTPLLHLRLWHGVCTLYPPPLCENKLVEIITNAAGSLDIYPHNWDYDDTFDRMLVVPPDYDKRMFLHPASLMAMNDVAPYFFGFFFG
ncbi:hypothetical protein FXO37_00073 [Capsicum annuum]|nr:hypothetical protein FXO37_00073 [Capsicum annuum]